MPRGGSPSPRRSGRRDSRRQRSPPNGGRSSRGPRTAHGPQELEEAESSRYAAPSCALFVVATLLLLPLQAPKVSVPLDLIAVGPGPISVMHTDDSVTVTWPDEPHECGGRRFPAIQRSRLSRRSRLTVSPLSPAHVRSIKVRRGSAAVDGTRSSTIQRVIPKGLDTCRARSGYGRPLRAAWQNVWRFFSMASAALSTATEIVARAQVLWTFPLRFAEIVRGDGRTTDREVIELSGTGEFGSQTFEWRAKANGWTWSRVAVWDVAGKGRFVNPFWRQ